MAMQEIRPSGVSGSERTSIQNVDAGGRGGKMRVDLKTNFGDRKDVFYKKIETLKIETLNDIFPSVPGEEGEIARNNQTFSAIFKDGSKESLWTRSMSEGGQGKGWKGNKDDEVARIAVASSKHPGSKLVGIERTVSIDYDLNPLSNGKFVTQRVDLSVNPALMIGIVSGAQSLNDEYKKKNMSLSEIGGELNKESVLSKNAGAGKTVFEGRR